MTKENVSFIYEQVVYWEKNLFLLPAGKVGKLYVDETSNFSKLGVMICL